jgi:hypothetical protein
LSLIDPSFSGWRKAIACIGLVAILPLIVIALLFKLIMLPFEKPSHRSAGEVARYLRDLIDGTGGEWDFDDFASVPLADPRLESIRSRAEHRGDGGDIADLRVLLVEAEAIAAEDRRQLVDLIGRVLAGDGVTGEMIDAALRYPRSLGGDEAKAYAALWRWVDDEDIRARDIAYARHQRHQLVEALATLSSPPASPA